MTTALDLGPGDVHVSGPVKVRPLADKYAHIDFTIPKAVREEAQRGLDWRKEHGRGGTSVGVATARTLVSTSKVSPEKARHIARYFPRHEVDKRGKGWSPSQDGYPSNGRIAWALWGGDAGRGWSSKLVRQMDAADARKATDMGDAITLKPISTKQRKALPANQFALPAIKKFPIHDAAHVRNAAARLEQAKKSGAVSGAQYKQARARIAAAANRFGIESIYNEPEKPRDGLAGGPRRGRLHMRIGLHPSGGHVLEVLHGSDPDGIMVHAEGVEIDVDALATVEFADAASLAADGATHTAADATPRPVWIQLAKVGSYRGHPAGPFELTPTIFDEIVRNFKATANKRIPIDFEHASEADATSGSIPREGAPAQGWIVDLDNRGPQGLWGLVEWLEPARSYILEKKYRYFSPAIRFGAKDRESAKPIGARMTSGALTNTPFLDGMQPLAAKDRNPSDGASAAMGDASMMHKPPMSPDMKAKLRLALRAGDLADYTEMASMVARLRSMAEQDGAADGVDLNAYCNDLRACMGMPLGSTVAEILEMVEMMIAEAIEDHEEEFHHMSDVAPNLNDSTETAVKLGEANARLVALTDANKRLENEHASLSLRLKDAESKIAEAEERATKAEAEAVSLRDQIAKRDEQAIEERVASAFDTYKDAKKLSDDDKAAMRITLKSDRALFDRLYPAVPPGQQHLLRNVASQRAGIAPQSHNGSVSMSDRRVTVDAVGREPGQPVLTPAEQVSLADRLVRERHMDAGDANMLAFRVARGTAANPFSS